MIVWKLTCLLCPNAFHKLGFPLLISKYRIRLPGVTGISDTYLHWMLISVFLLIAAYKMLTFASISLSAPVSGCGSSDMRG